jgi:deazaflavin-dependent oxidoreductase (nitroreductase family)
MRRLGLGIGALAALVAGGVVAWRRNPRIGTRLANEVVNPLLVRRGISGAERSEVGTIEHVGRRSGIRRLTPVHPAPTKAGFRIVVPLGPKSEWARNVLAAGRCRLQFRGTVYDLDEPVLLPPGKVTDIPRPMQWVGSPLGFQYLLLRRLAERPGALEPPGSPCSAGAPVEPPAP